MTVKGGGWDGRFIDAFADRLVSQTRIGHGWQGWSEVYIHDGRL